MVTYVSVMGIKCSWIFDFENWSPMAELDINVLRWYLCIKFGGHSHHHSRGRVMGTKTTAPASSQWLVSAKNENSLLGFLKVIAGGLTFTDTITKCQTKWLYLFTTKTCSCSIFFLPVVTGNIIDGYTKLCYSTASIFYF